MCYDRKLWMMLILIIFYFRNFFINTFLMKFMTILPLISAIVSFLVVLYLTPWLIKYLRRINLTVKDQNKKNTPLIPISGGLAVMAGIFIGLMFYIFFQTFYYNYTQTLLYIFAGLTSIIMIAFVGFVDDLIIKKNKSSSKQTRI